MTRVGRGRRRGPHPSISLGVGFVERCYLKIRDRIIITTAFILILVLLLLMIMIV